MNRFAYELCKALYAYYPDMVLICPNQKIVDSYDVERFHLQYWGYGTSHFWEQVSLPAFFIGRKKKYILLNFTGIGPICLKRKIITIHDLGLWVEKTWYSWYYRSLYKFLTPLSVATSPKVLTVSNFSKNEIVRVLGVKQERIVVVYNAIPSTFIQDSFGETVERHKKYILAVSSIDPRKNFVRMITAFKRMNKEGVELYIIGGKNAIFGATEVENETDNIHWLGRVSDEELKKYYQNAYAFIYPSLYEGFGIPVLEAMSMGCPVIASDIPVLHEVCGDAALYTNPYDTVDMANKMAELCEKPDLRDCLIEKGKKRFRLYSWQASANIVSHLLESLEVQYN